MSVWAEFCFFNEIQNAEIRDFMVIGSLSHWDTALVSILLSYYCFVLCSEVLIQSSQHDNWTHLSVIVALKLISFKPKY
jgi:hypothetical protein